MIRLAQKLVKPVQTSKTNLIKLIQTSSSPPLSPSLSSLRFFTSSNSLNANPVALQMINYALDLARSHKSTDSYAQGLLVLQQCLSREDDDSTKGTVLLAISTLLSERGDLSEAMDKLDEIKDMGGSSLGVRVAAFEGLIGLNLEMGQDGASSKLADESLELLKSHTVESGDSSGEFAVFQSRVKAVKGLVELVLGNTEKAGECFEGTLANEDCSGNFLLSRAEFLHATGNFALAKEYYQKAIQKIEERNFSDLHSLATCNMVPFEVLLAATCGLGQLEAHSGNFTDAEEILTRALTKAEGHFGSHHPKVGVILTCIAFMFRCKAKLEHSSSLLIQEGLYRKALEMLKAPSLESEESDVRKSDMVAMARGGYAELLCVQQNRKTEGDRMRKWAENVWRNRRLSLAKALEFSELPSKVAVVDTRISRAM